MLKHEAFASRNQLISKTRRVTRKPNSSAKSTTADQRIRTTQNEAAMPYDDFDAIMKTVDEQQAVEARERVPERNITNNDRRGRQGTEKFSLDAVSRVLWSIGKERTLRNDQRLYLNGFLNELKHLNPKVMEYNLALVKATKPLSKDALFCFFSCFLKSNIKWSTEQVNIMLNTMFDMENFKLHHSLDPEDVLQTTMEQLNPCELAFLHHILLIEKMTTEKFLYLTRYLERLKRFSTRHAQDYFSLLKTYGFLGRNSFAALLAFLKESKGQWKVQDFQKLEGLLKRNLIKKITPSVKPRKDVKRNRPNLPSPTTSNKAVVHHQDTHEFSNVMIYLLEGGLLNAHKLQILESFLRSLIEMGTQELHDYIVTLKRRGVLNNQVCYYLKNLLLENVIPLDSQDRYMLIKSFNALITNQKIKMKIFPSLTKHRVDVLCTTKNRNNSFDSVASSQHQQHTDRDNTSMTTISEIMTTNTPTSLANLNNSSQLAISAVNSNALTASSSMKTIFNVESQDPMTSTSSTKALNIRNYMPPKMSESTREKMRRVFDRLKTNFKIQFCSATFGQKQFLNNRNSECPKP
ncbi:hypothetical protein GQX74_007273 [Glossina fuscipes]|nr:hypothetical protein GQX74_007273 [Glossina fuscipes]